METIQPIEGITPGMLWTALYVIVGLCALVILADKVRAVFAGIQQRKQAKRPELADEISAKVLAKLEPRFTEIERKLATDKQRIDALDARVNNQDIGQRVLCRGVLALLSGNKDEAEKAKQSINDYLIEK